MSQRTTPGNNKNGTVGRSLLPAVFLGIALILALTQFSIAQSSKAKERYEQLQLLSVEMQKRAQPALMAMQSGDREQAERAAREFQDAQRKVIDTATSYAREFSGEKLSKAKGDDLFFIGHIHFVAQQMSDAALVLNRYVAENPQGQFAQAARQTLFVTFINSGQPEEAEKFLDSLPPMVNGPALLVDAFSDRGNYEKVIQYGTLALEQAQKQIESLSSQSQNRAGANPAAEQMARQFILSSQAEMMGTLAEAYARLGRRAEAEAVISKAREQFKSQPELIRRLELKMRSGALIGSAAPEIEADDWVGSGPVSLASLRGKVVMLDFFAWWCRPCIAAFSHVRGLKEKYGPGGLEIIGLTTYQGAYETEPDLKPEQELARMRDQFRVNHQITWPFGIAREKRNERAYNVTAIPHVVLVDKKGVIRYINVGAGSYQALEEQIKQLLAER